MQPLLLISNLKRTGQADWVTSQKKFGLKHVGFNTGQNMSGWVDLQTIFTHFLKMVNALNMTTKALLLQ